MDQKANGVEAVIGGDPAAGWNFVVRTGVAIHMISWLVSKGVKMRAIIMAAILLSIALPAEAQSRLPRKSPAERQADAINRSLLQEGRQLRRDEQIQIDRNQLRQNLDRQYNLSNPSPPARIGTCPRGSVGC
jgi:hypothetical protein